MRRRELFKLRAGQRFTLIDSGPMTHLLADTSSAPLQPDREPSVYSVRLSDGLVQWQPPGLIVYTESQHDAAERIGHCAEGIGVDWEAFHFPTFKQADEFEKWCQGNDVTTKGIQFPDAGSESPTAKFFSVRIRG